MGGGIGPVPEFRVETASLSAGHWRVSALLQAVAATGYAGVGAAVHAAGRGKTTAGRVRVGHLEGGTELVFPGSRSTPQSCSRTGRRRQPRWTANEGAAVGGDGFGRAGMGTTIDPGVANAALPVAHGADVSDVGRAIRPVAGGHATGKESDPGRGRCHPGLSVGAGDAATGIGVHAEAGAQRAGIRLG